MRASAMPRAFSRAMSASTCACERRTPATSARCERFASRMSYHAGITTPLLMVTGIDGACGNTSRTRIAAGSASPGTTCDQPSPVSPSPCSQITAASGSARVSISMAGRVSVIARSRGRRSAIIRQKALSPTRAVA
jgi:hypothetical protein